MPVVIEGGRRLQGQVQVDGAKNAALPIIAATLLTSDDCLIENVPFIEDIRNMIKVLHHHGVAGSCHPACEVHRVGDRYVRTKLANIGATHIGIHRGAVPGHITDIDFH